MVYTLQQMLEMWRVNARLQPSTQGLSTSRYDLLDIDSWLTATIDAWYLNLLDNGDERLLDPEEITTGVSLVSFDDGVAIFSLPDGCRRVVSVSSQLLQRPVVIARNGSPLARRQLSRFSRGTKESPVAVMHGTRLHVYGFPPDAIPSLDRVTGVFTPDGLNYRFSPAAIDSEPV